MGKFVKRVNKLLARVPKSVKLDSPLEIRKLNYKQLQAALVKLELPKDGKKEELVQRLLEHYGLTSSNQGQAAVEQEEADTKEAAFVSVEAVDKKEAVKAVDVKEAESKASRKRKWTKTDPAKFAPNEYHENLFRANFPLIDVIKVPAGHKLPGVDKFEGEVLDRDAKAEVFGPWIDRIIKASRYFRKPVNEKQAVLHHFALLEDLGDFTRITEHEVLKLNNLLGKKRKWEYVDEHECRRCQGRECSCEANHGIDVEFSVEDLYLVGKKGSKNKGLEVAPEDPSMLQGELEDPEEVTGFADAVLHVWDDRVVKRRKLDDVSYADPQRAACIVERKYLDDKYKFWAPFQGAYYAAKNALRNLQKGHTTPVYVLVLTGTQWTYGKLEPRGFVAVQDGRVDLASMSFFAEQQEASGRAEIKYKALQEKLDAGTAFYRKNYRENPTAQYRDQTMLVATFYLSSMWYSLPNTEVSHGCNNADVHTLFDGLLRVVIGDSVLEWTKEDFASAYKLRQDYIRTSRVSVLD